MVGIDDINLAALLDPPLTTVRHPIKALSEAAVDLLARRTATGPLKAIRSGPASVLDLETAARGSGKRVRAEAQLAAPPALFHAAMPPSRWRAEARPWSCAACTAIADRSPKAQ